jgi:hypothetical protein
VAAPPLDSPCGGPVTYPGDIKTLVKSSKGRSGPTLNFITNLIIESEQKGDALPENYKKLFVYAVCITLLKLPYFSIDNAHVIYRKIR